MCCRSVSTNQLYRLTMLVGRARRWDDFVVRNWPDARWSCYIFNSSQRPLKPGVYNLGKNNILLLGGHKSRAESFDNIGLTST